MLQVEVTETPEILDVFRCFRGEKLRQKMRRFAEKQFLEVPYSIPQWVGNVNKIGIYQKPDTPTACPVQQIEKAVNDCLAA